MARAWFLPLYPVTARVAAYVYYRVTYAGARVPPTGPALLVANHPNALLDPMLVVAAARRPVRFLAKAPLFSDRKIGWIVKAAGAIPVHRPQDDPAEQRENLDMFRAVHAALGGGAAVGIFPEGTSHSEPSLAPLKTGAARIALGAYPIVGHAFPIVPLGLVLREKDVFRSEALVLGGAPIEWTDLAARGPRDVEAVRELTERIDEALRQVTVNLERWADGPLVECAVDVWEAEHRVPPAAAERVERLAITTDLLARVRRDRQAVWLALADDVASHCRRLRRLRLRPSDVTVDVGLRRGLVWAAIRIPFVLPPATVLALAGYLLYALPYHLTGRVAAMMRPIPDTASTYKLMVGMPVYIAWVLALAAAAGLVWGLAAAAAALLFAPAVGMLGLLVREQWRGAWRDARRFLLLRSRRALVRQLADRQRDLAARLDALYDHYAARKDTA